MGMTDIVFWPFVAAFAGAMIIFIIVFLILWIWMIVDCAKRKFPNSAEKVVWLLVLIFFTWIGFIIYFIVIRMYNPKGIFKN